MSVCADRQMVARRRQSDRDDGMSKETFRCMVEHIRGAFAVMGTVDPPSTPLVLYALAGFDSQPTVGELADAAGISLKTASRTLKLLRKQGRVILKEDPHDSRMKRVALTKAGESGTAVIGSSFVEIAHRVVARTARETRRGRLSTRTKVLSTLVTLHIAAGLTLGSYVQQILGNTGVITATDTLSDGHQVGSINFAPP
jgi:DNA-binding MarR family transcriptional regulator